MPFLSQQQKYLDGLQASGLKDLFSCLKVGVGNEDVKVVAMTG